MGLTDHYVDVDVTLPLVWLQLSVACFNSLFSNIFTGELACSFTFLLKVETIIYEAKPIYPRIEVPHK